MKSKILFGIAILSASIAHGSTSVLFKSFKHSLAAASGIYALTAVSKNYHHQSEPIILVKTTDSLNKSEPVTNPNSPFYLSVVWCDGVNSFPGNDSQKKNVVSEKLLLGKTLEGKNNTQPDYITLILADCEKDNPRSFESAKRLANSNESNYANLGILRLREFLLPDEKNSIEAADILWNNPVTDEKTDDQVVVGLLGEAWVGLYLSWLMNDPFYIAQSIYVGWIINRFFTTSKTLLQNYEKKIVREKNQELVVEYYLKLLDNGHPLSDLIKDRLLSKGILIKDLSKDEGSQDVSHEKNAS